MDKAIRVNVRVSEKMCVFIYREGQIEKGTLAVTYEGHHLN